MPIHPSSFLIKPLAALALVGLADILLFDREVGWTLGLAAAAFPLMALALRLASRRGNARSSSSPSPG